MRKIILGTISSAALSLGGLAHAAELDIEITNVTHGLYFTPLLVAAHLDGSHLFHPGQAAGASVAIMAECGDISALASDLGAIGADSVSNPAGGLLAPGATVSTSLSTASDNSRLSLTAMMLPTNDAFVGADAIKIPMAQGTYTYYLNGYDAGTEANNELIDSSGCVAGMPGIPAAPGMDAGTGGTGVTASESNTHVHVHRGNLGDSDSAGGPSDLDSSVHRWQNPVAKFVVTVN